MAGHSNVTAANVDSVGVVRIDCRRLSWGLIVLLSLGAIRSEAQTSLTLAWDQNAETDLAGYVVHAGTAPGVYSQAFDVGGVTSFVFQPVVPGQRYCTCAVPGITRRS